MLVVASGDRPAAPRRRARGLTDIERDPVDMAVCRQSASSRSPEPVRPWLRTAFACSGLAPCRLTEDALGRLVPIRGGCGVVPGSAGQFRVGATFGGMGVATTGVEPHARQPRRPAAPLPPLRVLGAGPGGPGARPRRPGTSPWRRRPGFSATLLEWGSCGRLLYVDDDTGRLRALRAARLRAPQRRLPDRAGQRDAVLLMTAPGRARVTPAAASAGC